MGIAGVIQTKRLLKTDIDENIRIQTFATTAFGLWIPVIVLFLVVAFSDITFADIGFTMPYFGMNTVVTIVVMSTAAIFSAYFIAYRIIAFLFSSQYRQKRKKVIDKQASGGTDYYDLVTSKLMTPRTKKEKKWWVFVSLAAGVNEEIIFRGTYIFLLASVFPNLSIYTVFAFTIVLFGLGHIYQGVKGFVISALVGALFTAVFIVSGSLLIIVAIHFLTDLANAFEYSDETIIL